MSRRPRLEGVGRGFSESLTTEPKTTLSCDYSALAPFIEDGVAMLLICRRLRENFQVHHVLIRRRHHLSLSAGSSDAASEAVALAQRWSSLRGMRFDGIEGASCLSYLLR